MDNGKADIIAGIRELRAKAAEQLTGNEYYMIAQQLDSLATSAELSDEAARSVFNLISARLGVDKPLVSAGGPEVPETPGTPAQPDAPSGPEEPVAPDSPAQPDGSPGPEIPSPPSSPAEPQTPPEVGAAPAEAMEIEELVVLAPSASSFGAQHAMAVRVVETEPGIPTQEPASAAKPATGLTAAVTAVRALIEEKLSGNSYYAVANLLGQLQIMPPVAGRGEADQPENFEGALALLRGEAAHLSGIAASEASTVIAALENVLMPAVRPAPEKPVEAAAQPQPAMAAASEPKAAAPEPESEARTGFDDLAEAAWRRVQEVSADDPKAATALNGSAPAASAPEVEIVIETPVYGAPAEIMQQENAEAFNDGGFESRSSEPCYISEIDLGSAQQVAFDSEEPAAEAGAGAPSDAQRETAVSAEAPGAPLSASPDVDVAVISAEAEQEVLPEVPAAVPDEAPTVASGQETSAVEQPTAEPADQEAVAASQLVSSEATVAAEEAAIVVPEPAAAAPAAEEPAVVEAAPAPSATLVEAEPAANTGLSTEPPPVKPAKRGFFGRLFGGGSSAAEHR